MELSQRKKEAATHSLVISQLEEAERVKWFRDKPFSGFCFHLY